MEIVQDDLWLCQDCTIYAVNGDVSGIDSDARVKEVQEGVDALGPHLVPHFDEGKGEEEFSRTTCDGCGEWRAGSRYRFAVLGDGEREHGAPPESERKRILEWAGLSHYE